MLLALAHDCVAIDQPPIPLASFEATTVVLTPEGVLQRQVGSSRISHYGIDCLTTAAQRSDSGLFASIDDPLLLARTVERLMHLFLAYLEPPANDDEIFRHRLGRAAIIALIRGAARQAERLGATLTRDVMLARLLDCVTREALLEIPAP